MLKQAKQYVYMSKSTNKKVYLSNSYLVFERIGINESQVTPPPC